jgi:hypothetical protein
MAYFPLNISYEILSKFSLNFVSFHSTIKISKQRTNSVAFSPQVKVTE